MFEFWWQCRGNSDDSEHKLLLLQFLLSAFSNKQFLSVFLYFGLEKMGPTVASLIGTLHQ